MTNHDGFGIYSIGSSLLDTLDQMIGAQRIDPQLAMKILANFDRAVAETLNDKVKARLQFKVNMTRTRLQWQSCTSSLPKGHGG